MRARDVIGAGRSPRAPRRARRGEAGVTLIEVLIAVVLIGLTVGGIVAATTTLSASSGSTNRLERADVLLTSFSEAVKNLPYVPCAEVADYQAAFDHAEANLSDADQRLLQVSGDDATVLSVDSCPAPPAPAVDPGEQTIRLEVSASGTTRSGRIVKRDPRERDLYAKIFANELNVPLVDLADRVEVCRDDATGDPHPPTGTQANCDDPNGPPQQAIWFTAVDINTPPQSGSFAREGILELEWVCDDTNVSGSTTLTTPLVVQDPEDQRAACVYPAPAPGASSTEYIVRLTIRDLQNREATTTKRVIIRPADAAHQPPIATIVASPNPSLTGQEVTFRSTGPAPVEGDIVRWEWSYDDPVSGLQNAFVCTASDPTDCTIARHTFYLAGTYNVSLRITDNYGATATASVAQVVNLDGNARPIPSFRVLVNSATGYVPLPGPGLQLGLAPQTVRLDASASQPPPPVGGFTDPITSYVWRSARFGQIGTGQTLDYRYTSPVDDVITLTVTTQNGITNTTTRAVNLASLQNPTGFALTRINYSWNFIIRLPRSADFRWNNVRQSPGDQIRYEVQMRMNGGLCLGFGVKSTTFTSNGGATQTGTFPLDDGVCVGGRFDYRMRTLRYDSSGTLVATTAYTNWVSY